MPTPIPQAELVALLAQDIDAAALGVRHGLSEAEVLRLKDAFLAGLRASSAVAPRRRWSGARLVLAAGVLLATTALAQLVVFAPNTPALATQVNGNFAQLQTWLEGKVGAVGTAGVQTPSATVTGRLQAQVFAPTYSTWAANVAGLTGGAGIVNDNGIDRALMIVGNTASGSTRVVKMWDTVVVNGDLQAPANAWGSQTDLAEQHFSSNTTLTWTTCAPGTYVCGVGLGHHGGDSAYWTGARLAVRCCAL